MLLNCLQKTISSVEIMRISLTPISRQNVTGRKKTQLGTLSMKRRIFIAKFEFESDKGLVGSAHLYDHQGEKVRAQCYLAGYAEHYWSKWLSCGV